MSAPVAPSVRAGDREREQTANQLGQALAQGYFALDEYETRLQATFAAHTTAELRELVADLPLDRIRRNDPARRQARRKGGQARSADPSRGLPGDGRHRADRVAGRRPHRGRLVLLADLADPRRRHRSTRPRVADPIRGVRWMRGASAQPVVHRRNQFGGTGHPVVSPGDIAVRPDQDGIGKLRMSADDMHDVGPADLHRRGRDQHELALA